jgi:hypothetical protein
MNELLINEKIKLPKISMVKLLERNPIRINIVISTPMLTNKRSKLTPN